MLIKILYTKPLLTILAFILILFLISLILNCFDFVLAVSQFPVRVLK